MLRTGTVRRYRKSAMFLIRDLRALRYIFPSAFNMLFVPFCL